ncbi:hypothetical protein AVEN_238785-1 [Araneus ventricosus]|uniref:HTH CENPB-type domain-containing protein n=1 Tax=Araneus ventricosus TaxID=182803 RepID=A0A4Y2IZA8_ARAVE|nr:hypothetical protein AVEN_238785-1 [Araneus ventricosus]
MPRSSMAEEVFKGSRGWIEMFKRRTGIHSVVKHCEAASCDSKAEENFISDFKKLINFESYLQRQVFNCDETGLFWKEMSKRTYITEEDYASHDHTNQ